MENEIAARFGALNRSIIIFDFEVFRYDTLLGAYIINGNKMTKLQTWDLEEMIAFYNANQESIWIGHNNSGYDNFILQAVVKHKSTFECSQSIINDDNHFKYLHIKLYYYDLMTNHSGSLKAVECADGKDICTSEVDFNIPRPLTLEEKKGTEFYNGHDIDQTLSDFIAIKDEFALRLDVIAEFGLSMDCLHVTGTQLAETVLHAEKIDGIEAWVVKPTMYPTLRVKNQQVIGFYQNEDFKKGKKLVVDLCGVPHHIGSGGIHAAKEQYHADWAYYFDVSGYYNLVMILYDLLPRTIPDKYKAFYKQMYEQQLLLKKTNPGKRWVYKIILLSVFGAMTNKYCNFYDPYRGQLVTMTGEIFLVDLLEKLEGKVDLIQSNTDGIIAKPLPGVTEDELKAIINEWQQRTGFVLKLDKITDIHQRDVNCYMYKNAKGEIHVLGEALKYYEAWENSLQEDIFKAREPAIMDYMIVEYFMNHKMPEEVAEEHKHQLRMFQYVCKKVSYDYLEYQKNYKDGRVEIERLQNVNRAFALKSDEYTGMVYKCREVGKTTRAKVASLPDNCFVYDHEILSDSAYQKISGMIDWQYYIDRGYERIREFIKLIKIKDIE